MAKSHRTGTAVDAGRDRRSANGGEPSRTVAIDIGGSHTKASVLDRTGGYLAERVRAPTPVGSAPEAIIATVVDHLYIGGGNAKRITFEPDPDVTIVGNTAGITGGVAAWHD